MLGVGLRPSRLPAPDGVSADPQEIADLPLCQARPNSDRPDEGANVLSSVDTFLRKARVQGSSAAPVSSRMGALRIALTFLLIHSC